MSNSLKQLFRTPIRTLLFFLLMTAASLLLVFGSVLAIEADQRITAAESQFHTIGTVEQPPVGYTEVTTYNEHTGVVWQNRRDYDPTVTVDALDFEGAEYLYPPENRPYYLAYNPDLHRVARSEGGGGFGYHIVAFTPLQDYDGTEAINEVRVERVLYTTMNSLLVQSRDDQMTEGGILHICNRSVLAWATAGDGLPLTAGKHYVGAFYKNLDTCREHGVYEYYPTFAPYSSQCDASGTALESENTVMANHLRKGVLNEAVYYEEVTDDFYESDCYRQWLDWIEISPERNSYFPVLPTNSLSLLPSFHQKEVYIERGREISGEEFSEGAQVCMVSREFALRNRLQVGDKINLPMSMAIYGFPVPGQTNTFSTFYCDHELFDDGFSPFTAQGRLYEPFWEAEYEIVGFYDFYFTDVFPLLRKETELAYEMIIVPSNSVKASDENNIAYYMPMTRLTASFEIENGTIEAFDAKLRAAVSQAEKLSITYDDGGYMEVMDSLRAARTSAVLLFAVGLAAALAIILLLLYYFIVKQKKRTAIERSLGMSKRQCRVSLLSGIMVLAIAAALLGTAVGAAVMNADKITERLEANKPLSTVAADEEAPTYAGFDLRYSQWARHGNQALDESGIAAPAALYAGIPLGLVLVIFLLSLILVEVNLKIEPILLLSARDE